MCHATQRTFKKESELHLSDKPLSSPQTKHGYNLHGEFKKDMLQFVFIHKRQPTHPPKKKQQQKRTHNNVFKTFDPSGVCITKINMIA